MKMQYNSIVFLPPRPNGTLGFMSGMLRKMHDDRVCHCVSRSWPSGESLAELVTRWLMEGVRLCQVANIAFYRWRGWRQGIKRESCQGTWRKFKSYESYRIILSLSLTKERPMPNPGGGGGSGEVLHCTHYSYGGVMEQPSDQPVTACTRSGPVPAPATTPCA
jgi:hypothetical protein